MIIDLFMTVVITVLTGVFGLIPAYTLPNSMVTAGESLGSSLATANGIFPVGTVGICLGIIVGLRVFTFVWSLIVFIYDRIPLKMT